MFISLSNTCIQNFSNWHALFFFFFFFNHCLSDVLNQKTSLSVLPHDCVDPQMIHFELFYHLVRRSQFNPQTIFVSLGSWKKEGRSSSNSGYKIQKICGWKIYSRTRTFGAEVHKSNIRVKRWHNKYENSELDWKTQLLAKWFAY